MRERYIGCKTDAAATGNFRTSFWSTALIVILPKCPFCIMAYSSAITMCGAGELFYTSENNWVSYIPILLSLIIVRIIFSNKRGRRTLISASIAISGALLIILTQQTVLSFQFYNVGAVMLFFAIWLNGSLFSFVSLMKDSVKNLRLSWHR